MYHGYKNKGGGYWKGRSRFGKNYTSQYPPVKYFGKNSNYPSDKSRFGVAELMMIIAILFMIFVFIITR